jgi:hypothetical protein
MNPITSRNANKVASLLDAIDLVLLYADEIDPDESEGFADALHNLTRIRASVHMRDLPTGRRISDLVGFSHILSNYIEENFPSRRITRIDSLVARGDVEIILEATCDEPPVKIVYTRDGKFKNQPLR